MKSIKIAFSDCTPGFDIEDNFLTNTLRQKYEVITTDTPDDDVDVLFYSCFGFKNKLWSETVLRVYFTGENDFPNFNECDFAISSYEVGLGKRHLRLPLYAIWHNFNSLRENGGICDVANPLERGFCSLVMSNSHTCDPNRLKVIEAIGSYKKLASGGWFMNNIGRPVENKIEFCKKYKFNLALENSIVPGYVTEKISEAFTSCSVPIYFGTKDVANDFNPQAFINVCDFESLEKAVSYIRKVDNDDDLYISMLRAPKIQQNSPYLQWEDRLFDFLCNIVEHGVKYTTQYGYSGVLRQKQFLKDSFYSHPYFRKMFKFVNRYLETNYMNI